MQRRLAALLLVIHIGRQQFVHDRVGRRPLQLRRPAIGIFSIYIGFVGQHQSHHVFAAGERRPMQRRPPPAVLLVDLGSVGQQQFRNVLVFPNPRPVQRRPAVAVIAQNHIRIAFEQRLDLCQVPSRNRVLNIAAEGKAGPNQHEPAAPQHERKLFSCHCLQPLADRKVAAPGIQRTHASVSLTIDTTARPAELGNALVAARSGRRGP